MSKVSKVGFNTKNWDHTNIQKPDENLGEGNNIKKNQNLLLLKVISFEDLKAVGEISFLGNGTLIGTCYDLSPFPLGVIYCTNRPSR